MNANTRPTLGVWHDGELLVQQRAGVRQEADELSGMYKRALPAAMAGFLTQQPFAVLSTQDSQGQVWANLVAGSEGMISIASPTSVVLQASQIDMPLPLEDIHFADRVGLLVIDFSRRIRVRLNGDAVAQQNGDVEIAISQLYGNCSQYIQKRTVENRSSAAPSATLFSRELSGAQQEFVRRADTFFLASRHPTLGADASHRGGKPGFVTVTSPTKISFPDYSGNNMFNTLGNITVNPAVGLLFVDFESGRTLQLSGRASIDWDSDRASHFELAQRVIDVEIGAVREVENATRLRYRFIGYSPTLG